MPHFRRNTSHLVKHPTSGHLANKCITSNLCEHCDADHYYYELTLSGLSVCSECHVDAVDHLSSQIFDMSSPNRTYLLAWNGTYESCKWTSEEYGSFGFVQTYNDEICDDEATLFELDYRRAVLFLKPAAVPYVVVDYFHLAMFPSVEVLVFWGDPEAESFHPDCDGEGVIMSNLRPPCDYTIPDVRDLVGFYGGVATISAA